MEAYKSKCKKCGRTYFWTGYKTGLGKTPAQLEEMRRDETICRHCGADGLETTADRESEAGQVFKAQDDFLVGALSEAFAKRDQEK